MMPTAIDTGVIELYLSKHLKRKDARQFEMRLLRDATFLEKVFMQKAKEEELQQPNATSPTRAKKITQKNKKSE